MEGFAFLKKFPVAESLFSGFGNVSNAIKISHLMMFLRDKVVL